MGVHIAPICGITAKKGLSVQLSCEELLQLTWYYTYTYYFAESFSWYSLDREKHSWTPESTHSLFMPANNSSEKGSVSSILLTTSITILASPSRSLLLKLMLRLGMALRIATRDWKEGKLSGNRIGFIKARVWSPDWRKEIY